MKKLPRKLLSFVYLFLGSLTLALGVIGIILPILPTVPFFLLTAYFYAKGSSRFHQWFINSKLYKRYISGFAEHHAMSLGGELTLLIFVSLMLLTVTLVYAHSLAIAIILPTLDLVKYMYFIFKIKTLSKDELLALKQRLALEKVLTKVESTEEDV